MHIGILALQGAFIEHAKMLDKLQVTHHEIRNKADLGLHMDGIILPGGESTAIYKMLVELDMLSVLKEKIENGLPAFGTCAGLILLARQTSNNGSANIGTMEIVVKRNAYGRQLGSFFAEAEVKGIGTFPMVFIRAPYIESVGDSVDVLASVDGKIVACRQDSQLGTAFHPELTDNDKFHRLFIEMCK